MHSRQKHGRALVRTAASLATSEAAAVIPGPSDLQVTHQGQAYDTGITPADNAQAKGALKEPRESRGGGKGARLGKEWGVKMGWGDKDMGRGPTCQCPGLGSISDQKSDTHSCGPGRDLIAQSSQGVTHCSVNLPPASA